MMLLASSLWPGLAAALLLGLCIGAITGLPRERAGLVTALALGGALAVLAGLAFGKRAPGETGLWIESAALLLATYLAGCVAGGLARRVSHRA